MRGPEIYLYYPEGVGRSKLSGAVIENKLNTSGTARNWNTLQKLLEDRASARGRGTDALERAGGRRASEAVEQLAGQRLARGANAPMAACVYGVSCCTP